MTQLLIHSMREFLPVILPALDAAQVRRMAEVGAEHGGMSQALARYAAEHQGELVSIDPAPSAEFLAWLEQNPQVRHIASPSLEVLEEQAGIDAWFIDGDHNWYTVYHELVAIRSVCERDGKPLLVFLHDVGWPCARRDAYYAPQRIPAAYRRPHSFEVGVSIDSSHVLEQRGFRGMGQFAWSLDEGGPRNGVLTAVEDFVADEHEASRTLAWACLPAVFGLGVLFDLDAPFAAPLADILAPWHEHPLLRSLEENRLRNYLAVIDWQDRDAERRQKDAACALQPA